MHCYIHIFSHLYLKIAVNGSFIKDDPQEMSFFSDKTQQNQRTGNKEDILCCNRPIRRTVISAKHKKFFCDRSV